jgi:4-hydroxy-tetrahydrodipicolinate reductase
MKIALIGYGKMGKIIEKLALERGHDIVFRGTSANQTWKQANAKPDWDVAIEFTNPEAVIDNLEHLIRLGIPTICGSTGWNHETARIHQLVEENNSALISASNFSVGVNLFFAINRFVARLMNQHPDYKVSIQEIHHTEKKDAPSGTAITTAENIIPFLDRLDAWELSETASAPNKLPIEALRLPNVPGTHTVDYRSVVDTISIAHEANNRAGFAIGALISAEFIIGKKGTFTIQDVLNIQLD